MISKFTGKISLLLSVGILLSFSYSYGRGEGKVQLLFEKKGVKAHHFFSRPQGIFVDNSQEKIYIADTDNNEIALFSSAGEPIGILKTSQPLSSPLAIAKDEEGKIYISQREKKYLEIFNAKGKFLYSIPSLKNFPKEDQFAPGRFVFGPKGSIFIINRKTMEIWSFSQKGDFLFSFGEKGKGEGEFQFITDIYLRDNQLYVTDAQGIPLQVFSLEGKYLFSFGKHGKEDKDFSFPRAVAIDRDHQIWILDAFRHKVNVYNRKGNFLFQHGIYGTEEGKFCFPVDLDFDIDGNLYILEKGSNRFQVFKIAKEN